MGRFLLEGEPELGRAGAQANSTDGSATKIDVASTLKSDWERIESMAQRGGRC